MNALPGAASSFASTQAAWRFYKNPAVTLPALVQPLGDHHDGWLAGRSDELDDGDIPALLSAARAFPLTGIKAGELDTALGYFETNAPRMRYKHFRSLGLFVGSGAVEAGCKAVIGQRLKLSGMHWSQPGATGILTLRCQQASGRWDEIWQQPPHRSGAA